MIVIKFKKITIVYVMVFFGLGVVSTPYALTIRYGIELGLWSYVIIPIIFVSMGKSFRSFKIILNDDGIRRKYNIYFLFFSIYEENFLVPWHLIVFLSYSDFAFFVCSSLESKWWKEYFDFRNHKYFYITAALANYREAIAYIVVKRNVNLAMDKKTRNKLIKMKIFEGFSMDKKTRNKLKGMGLLPKIMGR